MDCPACHKPNVDGARFCAGCGAALPEAEPLVDPVLGTVIGGRFHVVGVLGEGGMGRVYAAEQQMGTKVRKAAVKMLLAQFAKDPQVVARFMRECGTVSELEHPNTIKVYDFGQTSEGDLYIAMELLAGASLEQTLLDGGPLSPERVDRILAQVSGSLQEAHDKGIVHRDLKPANIYLTKRSNDLDYVKVLDFGIAKREDKGGKEAKLTQQGTVLGTPPYMSPEQFRGHELDARSDIYSLGVMSYEMLTGRLPFDADTPWAWATQHMTAQPFPFETVPLGSSIPIKMRAAVMRALSKDRERRPQSVSEFYEEFTCGAGQMGQLGPMSGIESSAISSYGHPSLSGPFSAAPAAPAYTGQAPASTPPMGSGATSSVPAPPTGHSASQYPPPASGPAIAAGTYASSPAMEIPADPAERFDSASPMIPAAPQASPKRSVGAVIGVVAAFALVAAVGGAVVMRGASRSGSDKGDTSARSAVPPAPTASSAPTEVKPLPEEEVPDAGPQHANPPAIPPSPPPPPPRPDHAEACHHAESAAVRDNIPEAKRFFASCDGPERLVARQAIEAAEARARRCRGRHCPRGFSP